LQCWRSVNDNTFWADVMSSKENSAEPLTIHNGSTDSTSIHCSQQSTAHNRYSAFLQMKRKRYNHTAAASFSVRKGCPHRWVEHAPQCWWKKIGWVFSLSEITPSPGITH
jgi:hypothetical protein